LETFEQGLKILSGVNQVEMVLMRDLYKTVNDFKLKAPVFNSEQPPRIPTLNEQSKGIVVDENMWIWNT